jgi:hypothetical protein
VLALRVDLQPDEAAYETATELVCHRPGAPFMSSLHLGFYAGILLGSPFISFFLAQFILPALESEGEKYVLRAAGVGVGLYFGRNLLLLLFRHGSRIEIRGLVGRFGWAPKFPMAGGDFISVL